MLPLTFADPADYDKINPDDRVDVLCTELAVGQPLTLRVHPKDGKAWEAKLAHTFNESQVRVLEFIAAFLRSVFESHIKFSDTENTDTKIVNRLNGLRMEAR